MEHQIFGTIRPSLNMFQIVKVQYISDVSVLDTNTPVNNKLNTGKSLEHSCYMMLYHLSIAVI